MPDNIRFDIPALIILIGIVLGCFISFFMIKKSLKEKSANLFMGLLIFGLTMIMLEGWLNYTGLIFKALHLANFSEPLNFFIAPLFYLFVRTQLVADFKKIDWLHFIPFVLWLGYCMYFFLQPGDFKYNSIIDAMQLGIPLKPWTNTFSDNPWGIRQFVNELTIIHLLIYFVLSFVLIVNKAKTAKESVYNTSNMSIKSLRNSFVHFFTLFAVLVIVKAIFRNDVGDYIFLLYVTLMLIMTTFHIFNSSEYFNTPSTFMEAPSLKYRKSSLDNQQKEAILQSITAQSEQNDYFLSSKASLSDLSKVINESPHYVSQVINEKLGKSFFELMAEKRVEAAQKILRSQEGNKLTIEQISERVGYNSKSAFNSVFKKLTSQTPSSYRDSQT